MFSTTPKRLICSSLKASYRYSTFQLCGVHFDVFLLYFISNKWNKIFILCTVSVDQRAFYGDMPWAKLIYMCKSVHVDALQYNQVNTFVNCGLYEFLSNRNWRHDHIQALMERIECNVVIKGAMKNCASDEQFSLDQILTRDRSCVCSNRITCGFGISSESCFLTK